MRRLVGVLVVLLPLSMFLVGCQTKAPPEPKQQMKVEEMKRPPNPRRLGNSRLLALRMLISKIQR